LKLKSICELAREYWPNHSDLESADNSSYILKDGTVLDMEHNGIPRDHADVAEAWANKQNYEHVNKGMYDFMKECNAIRYFFIKLQSKKESFSFVETLKKPTDKQVDTIVEHINEMHPDKMDFYAITEKSVDEDYPGKVCEHSAKFKPRPMDVQIWISKCW